MRILILDVGGTHVKALLTGHKVPIKIPSGPHMTARAMARSIRTLLAPSQYDVVSIGYPGAVVHGKPVSEPRNLGGGWMGLGTGLGSALIIDGVLEPMELAHLPYKKGRTYEEYVGRAGLNRLGRRKWRRHLADVLIRLKAALEPDDVVVGGGNAKRLHELPAGVRLGTNAHAFIGGRRLWKAHA